MTDSPGRLTAQHLKGCRYSLWNNAGTLTERQQTKLAWIAKHNYRLSRAYLLKGLLRPVFQHRGDKHRANLRRGEEIVAPTRRPPSRVV